MATSQMLICILMFKGVAIWRKGEKERHAKFHRAICLLKEFYSRHKSIIDAPAKEGSDQHSPQYLITPTGAKVNRVFLVGTLTEKEDVGTEAEFWRSRIVDPTGTFFVTAGKYQPEAAQVLARTAPPEFVAVIGKPSTYTTKEGNLLTSIRAESIQVVDAATRDRWVMDATMHTARRLKKLAGNEADAVKAREHYSTNVEVYNTMVKQAIESVRAPQ